MKNAGFLKRLLTSFNTKSSQASSLINLYSVGKPVWTPRNYESLSTEGFTRNVIVYRCVNLIARSLASVPWSLFSGQSQLETHPLLSLLDRPNPNRGGAQFMEALVGYLLLSGNTYVEMVRSRSGKPLELYTLRPDRMRVIPSVSGVPIAYEYQVNGMTKRIAVNELNGRSSILHIKSFHPLNDWYGMSPIEAAAHSIDQYNAVGSHNLAMLQNGGRPSGALVVGTKHTAKNLTPEQRETLRNDIQQMYEGSSNAGRVMVLEGDFDWKEMGLSPKDLDFIDGKRLSAREIAQAYGVPPMLVGIQGDATYANYKEARFHLWEDTILPLLDLITDELNRWLTSCYEGTLKLSHDLDGIPALAPRRESAWKRVESASFLTINEKRAAVGYGAIPSGDRLCS